MNELRRGSETDRPSSKATNSEIVKALIVMIQSFTELSDPEHNYPIIINEDNLVNRTAQLIRVFQR